MALAHAVLVTHNCVKVVKGAASCHTVGDTQTNHDNQLRWHDDPLAQLWTCNISRTACRSACYVYAVQAVDCNHSMNVLHRGVTCTLQLCRVTQCAPGNMATFSVTSSSLNISPSTQKSLCFQRSQAEHARNTTKAT